MGLDLDSRFVVSDQGEEAGMVEQGPGCEDQGFEVRAQGWRKVIRALFKSYGDIWMLTLSPTLIRMKFLRIFPEICARTSCLLGNATRNIVPGST